MRGYPLFTNTIHSTLTRRFGESLRYSCGPSVYNDRASCKRVFWCRLCIRLIP
ncbi:hypothetical protein CPL00368_CDS0065 [Klebsiella phage DevonBitter]